jgi:hypothetical protein
LVEIYRFGPNRSSDTFRKKPIGSKLPKVSNEGKDGEEWRDRISTFNKNQKWGEFSL